MEIIQLHEPMHPNRELWIGSLRMTKNLAARLGVSHAEAAAMVSEAAAMIAARLSVPEEK